LSARWEVLPPPEAGRYHDYRKWQVCGPTAGRWVHRKPDWGPNALNLATSTMQAVSKIGYPESRIILAQCVIYLASSPKSNTAYKAINAALDSIAKGNLLPIVPNILPDSKEYLYPHDFGGYVTQTYLATPQHFVERTDKGFEKTLNEWLDKIHAIHTAKDSHSK
ncbi:MAG: hypothetical protein IJ950_02970, partial [Helicobacter sp.]|nr:hypothetical protein [Helicobacter sp.]